MSRLIHNEKKSSSVVGKKLLEIYIYIYSVMNLYNSNTVAGKNNSEYFHFSKFPYSFLIILDYICMQYFLIDLNISSATGHTVIADKDRHK